MKELRSFTPLRLIIYLIGIIILAAGITLNTKSGLGVSPVISVAYIISMKTGILFATLTFVEYCALIVLQIVLLRRDFSPFQFLQIGCSFFTSFFIGIYEKYLPTASSVIGQYVTLLLAIFLTSVGISLTVNMKVVPNPADGLANAIAKTLKKDLGYGKNLLDFSCLAITIVLSFLFLGRLAGVGIGTVVTMILTGRFVAMERGLTKKLTDWVFNNNE